MNLGGLWIVLNSLHELSLRSVEPSDHHQIAAKHLVGFCVSNIELKRLSQRPNGVPNFLLSKLTVAECVPAPCRCWTLADVIGEQRLDLLKSVLPDISLEFGDLRLIVFCVGASRLGYRDRVVGKFVVLQRMLCLRVARIELQGSSIGGRGSLLVPLLLQRQAEIVLRLRRVGLQLAG